MQQLHDWLERKLRAPQRRLREPMKATEEFRRHTGPRCLFGKVTLSATPAAEFSYMSRVRWPAGEQAQLFEDCVLDGILDVLVIEQTYPVLGVAVALEKMDWHEVDSCALGYGMAARQAMRRIIAPEGRDLNYELVRSPSG
jgi:hypothetical protein